MLRRGAYQDSVLHLGAFGAWSVQLLRVIHTQIKD
jgi:hypothetical protein